MSSQRRPDRKASTSLDLCQEPARGIKHEVTGRQLPSCLLSAPCPCMRDAKAGAYTSAALLQLLKTYCTLKETHFSKTISISLPWSLLRAVDKNPHTAKCRASVSPQSIEQKKKEREKKKRKDFLLHPDSPLLWHYTTHPFTQISRIPAQTAWKILS